MSPRQAIERLEAIRCALRDLHPFYAEHVEVWTATAQNLAMATMAAMRPEEVEPEIWTERTRELAAAVAAELLGNEAMAGMAIRLAAGEESVDAKEIDVTDPKTFRLGDISISDVEQWVEAGRNGTAPEGVGKRLDERDARKSNLQIAWRVMHAMRLDKNGDRLKAAIGRFMSWETGLNIDRVLAEILRTWGEAFAVIARDDLEAWIRRVIA